MIKQLFYSYKYRYDNLSDNSRQIVNLGILLLIIFILAIYVISLHISYTKNIITINTLAKNKSIVEELVKNIPPKLNQEQVESSLNKNNLTIKSVKWENNLELNLEGNFINFITWLQSTRFKIKDIRIIKETHSNRLRISAVLS